MRGSLQINNFTQCHLWVLQSTLKSATPSAKPPALQSFSGPPNSCGVLWSAPGPKHMPERMPRYSVRKNVRINIYTYAYFIVYAFIYSFIYIYIYIHCDAPKLTWSYDTQIESRHIHLHPSHLHRVRSIPSHLRRRTPRWSFKAKFHYEMRRSRSGCVSNCRAIRHFFGGICLFPYTYILMQI